MSESEQVEAHVPITISIDVEQLLKSELGWTTYNADDYDDPEPGYAPGGDGRIIDVVAMKLAKAIEDEVRTAVSEAVKIKALEKVDALIDDVMSGTIRLTSEYGEPKSPETTVREAMIKAMTDRLEAPVDRDGKTFDGRKSYGTKYTYLQYRAEQTAKVVLDKELSTQLAAATKQIKDKATDLVSKKISEALGRVL
jgi:hypothetical protein